MGPNSYLLINWFEKNYNFMFIQIMNNLIKLHRKLSLLDIITKVINGDSDIPFRPRLAELDTTPKFVTEVIKDCWDEIPEKRPDLKTIRARLKTLQKGMWVMIIFYLQNLRLVAQIFHAFSDIFTDFIDTQALQK